MGSKEQKAYRARMRAQVIAQGPDSSSRGSMQSMCFYGSKGDKPESERRPQKGGKVACRLTLEQKARRVRALLAQQKQGPRQGFCGAGT